MKNKDKQQKCELADDECNEIAKFKCESCGMLYCQICAENMDYECGCVHIPELIRMEE